MHGSFSRHRIALIVALAVVGLARTAAAARAADTPFQASGTFQVVSSQGTHYVITGEGHASPGGSFDTAISTHVNNGNLDESGVQMLDFGNGDTLTLSFENLWYPDLGERVGPYLITGGTGRFAGASGSGTLTGVPNTGQFYLEGTISW